MRIAASLLVVFALAAEGGSRMTEAADGPRAGCSWWRTRATTPSGIIDPSAGKQVATVEQSGVTGHEVIASPDGRIAYVPIYGDSGVGRPGSDGRTMDVIDIASRKRVATIDFGRPERPHCPMFGARWQASMSPPS